MEYSNVPLPVKDVDEGPAPGWTDFQSIFVKNELDSRERAVALMHESAHVWLGHNWRRPKDAHSDEHHHKAWTIATEMEVARVVYTDEDEQVILAPRSRLEGGYVRATKPECPYNRAQDIYTWLLEHPGELKEDGAPCMCEVHESDDEEYQEDVTHETVEGIVQKARENAEKMRRINVTSQIQDALGAVVNRKRVPTLASELDAVLRRRVEREPSYRRPSRRHVADGTIHKGYKSTPRSPRVTIYVDRSGSFSPAKTREAEQVLHTYLSRYGASIRYDVAYFSGDKVIYHNDPGPGGATPYHAVVDDIVATQPSIAVIITDDDDASGDWPKIPMGCRVLIIPIGCSHTALAKHIKAVEVAK